MTKTEIAKSFRDAADKLDRGETLSDAEYTGINQAAQFANKHQLEQAAAGPGKMSREAFESMSQVDRSKFLKGAGKLIDIAKL